MLNICTIIGDPHLKNSNIEIMEELTKQVELLGNPTIWLGDLLDTKEIIRGKCLNFWHNYFAQSPLRHIILVGNHDWFNLECKDHSLKTLDGLENVMIVDSLEEIGPNTYGIPYIHDEDELKKVLKKIPKEAILFGHLEVCDFDFGNGRICDKGLSTKSFKKFKKVVSGHFHKFQDKGNLMYLGTPFSHSFGESNQDKFIATIDMETAEINLIPTKLPKHIDIDINLDEFVQGSVIKDYRNKGLEVQNHYRFILHGTSEQINNVNKNQFYDSEYNIKFIDKPTDGDLI